MNPKTIGAGELQSLLNEKILPIQIYKMEGARFTINEIDFMINRTNKKLASTKIKIIVEKLVHHPESDFSVVNENNLEKILALGKDSNSLRVYLIHSTNLWNHESWTFDPIPGPEFSLYQGAIFITDAWADNTDEYYEERGYMPSCDTLLHELGHVLMQKSDHFKVPHVPNHFHDEARWSDDTINLDQMVRMRKSFYLYQ